ncbi:MAG: GNAT family N-acetyltransferase [Acidimicrobiia bacterium]|nr:GNAT family N-acetyltransferase [Acidimicrobiia bacterium]
MPYRIERVADPLDDRIVALRARTFGGGEDLNRRYLRWKYLENPYLSEPVFHVVLDGDHIVGCRGLTGAAWITPSGDRVRIPFGAEAIVDPDHRRKGVFSALVRTGNDDAAGLGFPAILSLSATPAARAAMEHLGYAFVAPYDVVLSDRGRALRSRIRRRVIWVKRTAAPGGLKRLDSPDARSFGVFTVDHALPDEAADVPPQSASGIAHERTAEYLQWRLGNPLFEYRVVVSQPGASADYVIVQANGSSIRFIDWAGTDDRVVDLMRRVVHLIDPRSVAIWGRWAPPAMSSFVAAAGRQRPGYESDRGLLVHHLDRKEATRQFGGVDLGKSGSWNLRMIDSDRY